MTEQTTPMNDLTVQDKRELKGEQPTRQGPYFEPHVDIYETQGAITLVAELPGARVDELEVDLRDSMLTLSARTRRPEGRWRPVHEEYRLGHYARQFRLGSQIDQGKISARLEDGVLTLTLPKIDAVLPRKIRVESH